MRYIHTEKKQRKTKTHMPNYHNSKIYKIWSPSTDMVYIGSTTQSLAERLGNHVRNYKCFLNGKNRFVTSFKIIKYGDYKIELVENIDCNNREELNRSEGKVIRNTENCINRCIAGRTPKQYKLDNKQQISIQRTEYRQNNKKKISKYNIEYYQKNIEKIKIKINCECGSIVRKKDIAAHRRTKKHREFIENQ